jgi:hypothetical protein
VTEALFITQRRQPPLENRGLAWPCQVGRGPSWGKIPDSSLTRAELGREAPFHMFFSRPTGPEQVGSGRTATRVSVADWQPSGNLPAILASGATEQRNGGCLLPAVSPTLTPGLGSKP